MKAITACTMDCGDCCSLLVDTEEKTIKGNPRHPFTQGFCCKKGSNYFNRLMADDRITTPQIREKGQFRDASWDEALDLIAHRLNEARVHPESILHAEGYGYRGVLAKATKHFFKYIGASTLKGSLCDGAGMEASIRDFGILNHNTPSDLLNANRIINWGRDLTRSSIHQLALVHKARKQGTEVLSISPGGDATSEFSDVTIVIRPGTDRFLAAAVLKLYLEAGDLNPWVLTRCANWPALRGLIDNCSLSSLTSMCEVATADVEMLYDWYAESGNVATLIGWGLQRHLYGGENVRFIDALAMISGNIGISGGGVYFNIPSSRNLGSWEHLLIDHPVQQRELQLHNLGVEIRKSNPQIAFIWVNGHNIVNQTPDCLSVANAFHKPFVVCVEGFMNDTAMTADVILPPAFMFETEDVLGSCLHDYVNYCAAVVPPQGQAREIFDIMTDLGTRLAAPISMPERERCLQEGLKKYNISLEELRDNGFAKVNHPILAFENLQFGHSDGRFCFPETLTPEPHRDPDYPLQLLTLGRGKYLHSQIPEKEQCGIPSIWISKQNPAWAALNPAQDIYLVTPSGSMQVQLKTEKTLHPRAVIIRRGGWMKMGQNANVIIQPLSTDMGDGAAFYSQTCRLENR